MKEAAMRERVRAALQEFWSDRNSRDNEKHHILSQDSFVDQFEKYGQSIVEATLKIVEKNDIAVEVITKELRNNPAAFRELSNYKNNLIASHNLLNRRNTALRNIYLQESDLDLKERWRFLAFRIATGLGFAAIVLLTGFLAKHWEIPLPMLRPLG